MARHYVSIARGTEAGQQVDYHVATTESGTDLFSFSVLDGVTPTKVEVIKALEAFERYFENAELVGVITPLFDVMG
jgi:hypothetical protein